MTSQRQTWQAEIVDTMKTNIVRILNEIVAFNKTQDANERKIHVGNVAGYAKVFTEYLRQIAEGRQWPDSIMETWTQLWETWDNGNGNATEAQMLARRLMEAFSHIEP